MVIHPKNGLDQLLFGMSQADVQARYGAPDKMFQDEEENNIWVYNAKQVRLTSCIAKPITLCCNIK